MPKYTPGEYQIFCLSIYCKIFSYKKCSNGGETFEHTVGDKY